MLCFVLLALRTWLFCLLLVTSKARESPLEECDKKNRSAFLWKIERHPPAYLFGTVHVPFSAVWSAVSPVAKRALDIAENLFFELDLTDPKTAAKLTKCQLLPEEVHLEQIISSGLILRIEKHLQKVKNLLPFWLPTSHPNHAYSEGVFTSLVHAWKRKRPVWILLMLMSLTPSDISSFGTPVLDVYLTQRARQRRKRIIPIETVSDQCNPLNAMPLSHAVFALRFTLEYLEEQIASPEALTFSSSLRRRSSGRSDTLFSPSTLIRSYRCGHMDPNLFSRTPLPAFSSRTLSRREKLLHTQVDDYLRLNLIDKRNRKMASRIVYAMMSMPAKSQVFTLGIGHLLGQENSVLSHIAQAGYIITPLAWDQFDQALLELTLKGPGDSWDAGDVTDPERSVNWQTVNMITKQDGPRKQKQDSDSDVWEKAKLFARNEWNRKTNEKNKMDRLHQRHFKINSATSKLPSLSPLVVLVVTCKLYISKFSMFS